MSLRVGTALGPYEILALLGAGGMGEVYRARDVRLKRTVAIKVLSAREAQGSEANQRFDREAKTISSLNHPNICHLYDVGTQDGISYLVMEYLEGETIADRLRKGRLPLDQVLAYGISISDALENAHRHGVIHRDLKPGNMMLTKTGLKLMDFGLAKFVAPPVSATTSTLGIVQDPLTGKGAMLGTLQYMSPEQVEGREADRRSDIFSLGAVLYEMVTGKRAFEGNNTPSVIAAVLEKEPTPMQSFQPLTPPALDHAVTTCLAKDPEARWQTARDLGLQLRWIATDSRIGIPARAVSRRKLRERYAWAAAALLALACAMLVIGLVRREHPPVQQLRVSLQPPPGTSFSPYNFAIAPDGSRLAFVALGPDGDTSLWVRGLSSPDAQYLTGTEGAAFPFWSPDSENIGFFAQGKLKAVNLETSAVQNVCDATTGFGGSWNQDGIIVFASERAGPIYWVPAAGGTPEEVTKTPPGSGESQHWPFFLPDGKHFLYFVDMSGTPGSQHNGIYVGSLDGGTPQLISPDITGNVLFAAGNLVYVRDRTIVAQPFDSRRLRTTGPAIPLTRQEVDKFLTLADSGFSVSRDGKLIFQSTADDPARLIWYDSTGKELGQFHESGYDGPQFSPDGRSLAVFSDDEHNGQHFIRVYDLQRGISTRLTEGGSEVYPVWSADGKFIAYREGSSTIEEAPADGSRSPQPLVNGVNVIPCDWSADGNLLFMRQGVGDPFPNLHEYSLLDQKSTQYLKRGSQARLSPDGRWIAYIGPPRQIFVQPFHGSGARIQISNAVGSAQPRWSPDGKKIFFVQPDRKLMFVTFDPKTNSASAPQVFAQTRMTITNFAWFQYAVAPDGRLLVNSLPANSSPLTLITGWDTLLHNHR